jgi:hypothetical protein
MKPLKLRKFNYISPLEKRTIDKLAITGLYIAIALLLIIVFLIKSGVN